MAKALAKAVFGQAERLVRFDMSEYRAEHADQRLLGAPPGYTGYDEGGQLTDAVKKQPFSLLLFDVFEKAHPLILYNFLQILDDGRPTDGRGETAYFSESVIIFTSNLGILPMRDPEEDEMVTPAIAHAQMKEIVLRRIGKYFTHHLGRPELLNRFGDSFVVFDFIRPPHHAEIVRGMVAQLVTAAAERGRLGLEIEEPVYEQLIEAAVATLANGGRGIRNLIDSALVNPLARALAEMQLQSPATVRVQELFLNPAEGGRPTLKLELEER
jgi:ATP-dependent Clp protease ATP-binding subunit ClpA